MSNIQNWVLQMVKAFKINDSIINNLFEAKADSAKIDQLKALNDKIKTQINDLLSVVKQKIDPSQVDDIMTKISDVMSMKSEFDDIVNSLWMNVSQNYNPMEQFTQWTVPSLDMNTFGQMAMNWNIQTSAQQWTSVDSSLSSMLDNLLVWFKWKLNSKFWTDNNQKSAFIDNIISKITVLLSANSFSAKTKSVLELLSSKLNQLKIDYNINFNLDANDLNSIDLNSLLEVK